MHIKYNFGKCQLEFDAANPKEAIKELSAFQEILSETTCGECNETVLKFEHRVHEGNDYYSIRCCACGAQISFGQHRTGDTLFAKRDRGNRGWYHFRKGDNDII